jgi:hypothetical protein
VCLSDLTSSTKDIARMNAAIRGEVVWLRFSGIFPRGRAGLLGAAYCSPQGSSVYGCFGGSGLASADVPDAVFLGVSPVSLTGCGANVMRYCLLVT